MAEKITSKKSGATTANSTSAWLRCERQPGRGWYAARKDELRRRSIVTNAISSLSHPTQNVRPATNLRGGQTSFLSLEPVRPDAPLNGSRGHFVRLKPLLTAVKFHLEARLFVKKKIKSDLVAVRRSLGRAASLA